ncbi:ATP-binding protein, partial [Eubacteriales bacterium OttesenSCG-928-M02]|nr:ATP-binding protein [Eubacteriales bacterium OttesenSCG-928-M02]
SLSHFGVLFLDEFPEFHRDALEALRQPVEDGITTVTRMAATVTYPSDFMLVAAMNPCPCGQYGTDRCRCSPIQVQRYLGRISGPLLSRIDMHVEMGPVDYQDISQKGNEEPSETIAQRVNAARQIQAERFAHAPIYSNARMSSPMVREYCTLEQEGEAILEAAFTSMGMSARAYTRVLKVARTIADLEGQETIQAAHVAEALSYRSLDRKYWGV